MTSLHLEVDTDVLAQNLTSLTGQLAPAEVMLVVKNDAYAHGVSVVAPLAYELGIRWYGAFDVTTAEHVQAALAHVAEPPRVFVWVLVGNAQIDRAIAADMDLGVGDAALLEQVIRRAHALGRRARVHLKVDTGLRRNGVRAEDWPAFVDRAVARSDALEVVGVWSHIAEASDAEDDDSRTVFLQAVSHAVDRGVEEPLRHLAASAAGTTRPEFRFDLARIGAFVYGIRPAGGPGEDDLGIRPAATLFYRGPVTRTDSTVVLHVGSIDGIPSTLAGRASVLTADGPRRIIRITPTTVAVESWEDTAGEQVVGLFGPPDRAVHSATDLAEMIDTIGEEIVTRVGAGANLQREVRPAPK